MSCLPRDRVNFCADLSPLPLPIRLEEPLMPLVHGKLPCHDAPEPKCLYREELVEVSDFQNLAALVVLEQPSGFHQPIVLARSPAR